VKNVEDLIVCTTGGEFYFKNENAEKVYEAINKAGARGAEWTTPVKLSDGRTVVFIVRNIAYFEWE
jgi:hypothetical protein